MNPDVRISDQKSDIDFDILLHFLSKQSYWSANIPSSILKKAVENSICFSIIHNEEGFIGFARMITDSATFGYLADVFVDERFRGRGLGKLLLNYIMEYPDFQILRNWFLYTKDAHEFYEQFGWKSLDSLERAMVIRKNTTDLYTSFDQ